MNLLEVVETDREKYHTDKFDLGYIHEFYNEIFTPRKYQAKSILEIGINSGSSILLWRDFFPKADVYGIDITHCGAVVDQPRIYPVIQNAYCADIFNVLPTNFDIMIDDGPHTKESMEFFIAHYLSLLNPGGVAIIEDIIDITWTQSLLNSIPGEYLARRIAMAGLQKNPWHLDRWQAGLDVIVINKLTVN